MIPIEIDIQNELKEEKRILDEYFREDGTE